MLFRSSTRTLKERFEQISGAYEREQVELKEQASALKAGLETFERDSENVDSFLALTRRYTTFDELTTPMLNEFVSKILIHEADKSSGERVQVVDVHFNFIGRFKVPRVEAVPAPEELEAEEKRMQKLMRQRAANRRYYAKQKAKQEQEKQKSA